MYKKTFKCYITHDGHFYIAMVQCSIFIENDLNETVTLIRWTLKKSPAFEILQIVATMSMLTKMLNETVFLVYPKDLASAHEFIHKKLVSS